MKKQRQLKNRNKLPWPLLPAILIESLLAVLASTASLSFVDVCNGFVIHPTITRTNYICNKCTNNNDKLFHSNQPKDDVTTIKRPSRTTIAMTSNSNSVIQPASSSSSYDNSIDGYNNDVITQLESYIHDDKYNISYQYKEASVGYENDNPIVLIHPIGIGMSSWFWNRFLNTTVHENNSPAIYALNLIGCGKQQNNAMIHQNPNSNKKGQLTDDDSDLLFDPLVWVEQCETLINTIVLPRYKNYNDNNNDGGVIVIAQGGLAPIGVLLAARNTPSMVQSLILTSPPSYKDMIIPVPMKKIRSNYRFLSSKVLGTAAFKLLERKRTIQFFSNLFLFASKQQKCDDMWLQYAINEACYDTRPPVQAFNSGVCLQRSLEKELCKEIQNQPILILQGDDDIRRSKEQRIGYRQNIKNSHCTIESIPGKNVLPWESPKEVWNSVRAFLSDNKQQRQ